ncbi:MAG: hypothetical protein J7M17_04320, partial [Anaerolineae bacterium]|nr:hypothetical protein [Anaerolineae bacterium]
MNTKKQATDITIEPEQEETPEDTGSEPIAPPATLQEPADSTAESADDEGLALPEAAPEAGGAEAGGAEAGGAEAGGAEVGDAEAGDA